MSVDSIDLPVDTGLNKKAKATIQVMVDYALKCMNERSGSSVTAIKKFISGAYSLDVEKSSRLIKKYIKESVENGKLIQTKGKSLSGSFRLSKEALKGFEPKPRKPRAKKSDEGKDKKTTAKGKDPNQPKTKKAAADPKKKTVAVVKTKEPKKAAAPKKDVGIKLTGIVPKLTAKAQKAKVANQPPAKEQQAESEKPITEMKAATGTKKVKSPATKKKVQPKKKEEPEDQLMDNENSSDDSSLPETKEEDLNFSDNNKYEDSDKESDESADLANGLKEEELNESDKSVSSEESPVKPTKAKVSAKPAKNRKSIATLAKSAKPAKPKVGKR